MVSVTGGYITPAMAEEIPDDRCDFQDTSVDDKEVPATDHGGVTMLQKMTITKIMQKDPTKRESECVGSTYLPTYLFLAFIWLLWVVPGI